MSSAVTKRSHQEPVSDEIANPQKKRRKYTIPALQPFDERAKELQQWLNDRGLLPWKKSHDPKEARLGRWVEAVTNVRQRRQLEASHLESLVALCPAWDLESHVRKSMGNARPGKRKDKETTNAKNEKADAHDEKERTKASEEEDKASLQKDRVSPEREACVRDLQWVRKTIMALNMRYARCRGKAEKRALLRKLQLEFHPDKNQADVHKIRPVYDFVQKLWDDQFKSKLGGSTERGI